MGTDYRNAPCLSNPGVFFPAPGTLGETDRQAALAICRTCDIEEECLQDNILEADGIWGGTTPEQRAAIRQRYGITPQKRGKAA